MHVTLVCDDSKSRIVDLERKLKSFESQRKEETDTFNNEVRKKLDSISSKIRNLESDIGNIKDIIKKPNDIDKAIDEKIEIFENRLELLRKAIEEKDTKINHNHVSFVIKLLKPKSK